MAKSNPGQYSKPGVYVEELSVLPPTVPQAETALPAFLGYTQMAGENAGINLQGVPRRISSMGEYENYFGTAAKEKGIQLNLQQSATGTPTGPIQATIHDPNPKLLYYSLQAFFENGGSSCFVISLGDLDQEPQLKDYQDGLLASTKEARITLLCFPDAVRLLGEKDYYQLMGEAMLQCSQLRSRFLLVDLQSPKADHHETLNQFRNGLSQEEGLGFAAAYYPDVISRLDYAFEPEEVTVNLVDPTGRSNPQTISLKELKDINNALYFQCLSEIQSTLKPVLPPSPFIAGIYARVDGSRGVWKAPANVALQTAQALKANITQREQEQFNVDTVGGKSVNVIRQFPGRGILVWGARTLAGNDNEWRYVPVRRFMIMVESSLREPLERMGFEPNEAKTWIRAKAMTENFFMQLWRSGALQGQSPDEAFFVKCGLGETMTQNDFWEGRMILEMGLAVVKPAEFLILRLTQKMKAP
ncbi:phage tail sheath family protein [Pararhodonellum marinum]|uniref:phage tail sheath family protein n=1 Tax=Pararhodonellum marinum TaxID=2755358 RepID=UPI00188FF344|nr:phage tail sheath C-terminal domain-containing protein [Pararhodonellum marinum]